MGKNDNPSKSSLGWLPSGALSGFTVNLPKKKQAIFDSRVSYMLLRCLEIFEWKNLPETLDARTLELYLLTKGYAIVYKCDKEHIAPDRKEGIYTLDGSLGGQLDASYFPTLAIPVSPYLNLTRDKDLRIGEDIVVVRNDANCVGFVSLLSLYGAEEAEAFLTLRMQLLNLRSNKLLLADNDTAKSDAETYLKKLDEGELGVIGGKRFFEMLEGIKTEDMSPSAQHSLKDTIEVLQYLDGKLFNELGLNASFNMKREALNDDEVGAGEDTLFPLVEHWWEWRKKGAKEINRLYGTDCSVDLKSSWKRVLEERVKALEDENADLKLKKAETEKALAEAKATVEASKQVEDEGQTDKTPQGDETPPETSEETSPSDPKEDEPKDEEGQKGGNSE